MKKTLLLIILMILALPLWAQKIIVDRVEYSVSGRTLVFVLAEKADFPEGAEYKDEAAFLTAIGQLQQRLLNERVLEEVKIEYTFIEEDAEAKRAIVNVRVKDTWNIIALPYFRYDSNEGLLLSIRGRDYNFLGSMQALRLNLNYEEESDGEILWSTALGFSLPISLWGMNWNMDIDAQLSYQDGGINPSYSTCLEFGSSIPLGPGELGFYANTWLYGNDRGSAGHNYDDRLYFTSGLGLDWKYRLFKDDNGRSMVIKPYLRTGTNWFFTPFEDEELKDSFWLSNGVNLSWGNTDWVENLRYGESFNLTASVDWHPVKNILDRTISSSAELYREFGWFGINLRSEAFYAFDAPKAWAGSSLRGILDNRAITDAAISFNVDLPISLYRFLPSQWFGIEWMRYLEFEQQLSLFFDMSQGHYNGSWFLVSDGWYAAGVEVLTYPLAMRSFYLRVSFGVDLISLAQNRDISGRSQRDDEKIWELFIGMSLHY